MNLYLIRHSISENSSFNKKDFERELTDEGIFVIKNSATEWRKFIGKFDVILTSPLERAVKTAELISPYLQFQKNIIKENNLGTGSKTSDLIEIISAFDYDDIAVVGHQPDLSNHINNLCGKGIINLNFPPASIAKIEFSGKVSYGTGKLIFILPPFTML